MSLLVLLHSSRLKLRPLAFFFFFLAILPLLLLLALLLRVRLLLRVLSDLTGAVRMAPLVA
jgi:hypothetical protein